MKVLTLIWQLFKHLLRYGNKECKLWIIRDEYTSNFNVVKSIKGEPILMWYGESIFDKIPIEWEKFEKK